MGGFYQLQSLLDLTSGLREVFAKQKIWENEEWAWRTTNEPFKPC